jgi:heme/copper-type cytochrome/quinol oxidase subunit 2
MVGLANFMVYTVLYVFIGGEAVNGDVIHAPDGSLTYELQSGIQSDRVVVSRAVFIYSGIHSITIWPTVGAILLAMLTLAKDRIVSSMRSSIVRGRTMITILATIITLIILVMTFWFILHFANCLAHPRPKEASASSTAAPVASSPAVPITTTAPMK